LTCKILLRIKYPMSERFSIFNGQFYCQKCNEIVDTSRLWTETKDVTWMCSKKHISKVSMIPKTKKDYDSE
jgi:hypothetical protein